MLKCKTGKVDLWAEAEDRDKLPPAMAESSKKLNDCLRRLYDLELKADFDSLEPDDNQSISIDDVVGISERLESAEAVANEFVSFNYGRKSALRKVEQVKAVSERFDDVLSSLAVRYFDEFKEKKIRLEREENLKKSEQLREIMDKTDDRYQRLAEVGDKREIEFRFDVRATFKHYEEKKEEREKAKRNVDILYDRYFLAETKKDMQKIQDEIKSGWFSDSEAVEACKNAGYREGVLRINRLEKDVSRVLKDYSKIAEKKKSIKDNIERLEADYRELEDMEKGKKCFARLKEIREGANPDKYESSAEVDYLEANVKDYRIAAEKVLEKAEWLDNNKHRLFLEKMTGKGTKAKKADPKKEIRKYFSGLLKTCRNNEERHKLYVQAVDKYAVEMRSVDGSGYFGINFNLNKLGENEKYSGLRDILDADRKACVEDLVELNKGIRDMTESKDFARNQEDLEYIEGFYCCVREPLRRGAFLRLRTPENEGIITELLDNFEDYIKQSRKELITQGSLQYSKVS
ncbi:hypothetical protein KY343_01445 [Candidatus Woesearchaeota archaeon]|nr:hypothetical protein [Candidatus Woesearchaeota archaeon]